MTGAQPGFERRLSAALDAAPSRIPVVLGGCGTGRTWLLHTRDMHPLYRKLGFGDPSPKVMERLPPA